MGGRCGGEVGWTVGRGVCGEMWAVMRVGVINLWVGGLFWGLGARSQTLLFTCSYIGKIFETSGNILVKYLLNIIIFFVK